MRYRLVGLMGEAQNGKSSVAKYLVETRNAHTVNFSRLIKNSLRDLIGLTHDQLYGKAKEQVIRSGPLKGWTPRALMQDFGDVLKKYNKSIFTRDGLKQIEEVWMADPNRLIVIEDVRFPTREEPQVILGKEYMKTLPGEDDLIRKQSGVIIKVVRTSYSNRLTNEAGLKDHDSEVLQKLITPDYTIEAGNGELNKLYTQVDLIIDGKI